MYATSQLSIREPLGYNPNKSHDLIKTFKAAVPKETLQELEAKAKHSPRKMLQLADALMTSMNGWPRNPHRACNLFRAAAWGCTEEEEPERGGVPVGIPQAMIATSSLGISFIKCSILGLDNSPESQNMPFEQWLDAALSSERGIGALIQVFDWVAYAVTVHGWVTSLTIMLAQTVRKMNFINDRRLRASDESEYIIKRCETLMKALDCRDMELMYEKMQAIGKLPRGDPSTNTIELFKPKALEIFSSLLKVDDTLHIVFKQVPRSPFPMVVIALYASRKKVQKIVRLPSRLQMTPFTKESFVYVWLQIAYDIHLGRLGTGERVRPAKISIPDTHGNKAFASYLKETLNNSDTKIQCVSPTDSIKVGKRSTTLGQVVNDVIAVFLDLPGVLTDGDSINDVVVRAQEAYFDSITQQLNEDDESQSVTVHVDKATHMKGQGNHFYGAQEFTTAVRCYSTALGHMRRVVEHDDNTYKLLGTLLSNRAACFLSLAQGQHTLEFRKIFASNAINDCTTALGSSWASSSLPSSIMEKLRFRCDKATAQYDTLNENFDPIADVLFSSDSANDTSSSSAPAADNDNTERIPSDTTTEVADALIEYGEVIFKNRLAKNYDDGCPICLRQFNTELSSEYAVVLPCGEHAVCSHCTCTLKIESDKEKEIPQCPLCRYSFDPAFVEGIPNQIIEKDQELANLIVKLPNMTMEEKIDVAERLMWTHRFEVSAVVDAIEALLEGEVSGLFFRSDGDLTHDQKNTIYNKARMPVLKLEAKVKELRQEYRSTFDSKGLEKICGDIASTRAELNAARIKARDEIYSQMNSVGSMGAEEVRGGSSVITVDYHGLHVSDMRRKFKEHVIPILPVVKVAMVIVGRGLHSAGKEGKLKKALFKLIAKYDEDIKWQRVNHNEGALYVMWRDKSSS